MTIDGAAAQFSGRLRDQPDRIEQRNFRVTGHRVRRQAVVMSATPDPIRDGLVDELAATQRLVVALLRHLRTSDPEAWMRLQTELEDRRDLSEEPYEADMAARQAKLLYLSGGD